MVQADEEEEDGGVLEGDEEAAVGGASHGNAPRPPTPPAGSVLYEGPMSTCEPKRALAGTSGCGGGETCADTALGPSRKTAEPFLRSTVERPVE
jgi:hypothetical protein